eukprot:1160313-Pelagomonas_calceolata.AAC.1
MQHQASPGESQVCLRNGKRWLSSGPQGLLMSDESSKFLLAATAAADDDDGGLSWSSGPQEVHSYEVQLVIEYCDRSSLREALDAGMFLCRGGQLPYKAGMIFPVSSSCPALPTTILLRKVKLTRNKRMTPDRSSGLKKPKRAHNYT